ncbi:dyslexia-associated protein KIAA0319 isoform X2 [Brienomyrus brachyistius]|nr:dyslexia-associated protein KIAA0319 isoform X2 [Brienomyrus brachyistius]XP_048882826.1 dyslexia-associated protein KIAA0319 isoform X2 [Brienomyrus brachyistius]
MPCRGGTRLARKQHPVLMGVVILLLCLALQCTEGAVAEQCWQGATYSESVVSPNLKSGNILRVPEAPSVGQCAKACCELPGCDLAWLFERHCYVLSCQRQERCQPRPRPGSDSYIIFVRRGPASPLVLQSLARGQSYPGRWRPLSRPKGPAAVLRDLALFDGTRDLSELDPSWTDMEYSDRSLEDGSRFGMEVKSGPEAARTEQKESSGYLDWLPLLGREEINVTDIGGGSVERESLQNTAQDGPSVLSSSPRPSNGISTTESTPTSDPAVSPAAQNLTSEELPDNGLSVQMQPTVFPQDSPADPPPQRQITTCLPTGSLPPVLNRTTPTAAPQKVGTLLVSAGDPVEVMLPMNTVELRAVVVPEPQTESTYSYEWSLRSYPNGHQGEMEGMNSKTVKLSGLSEGVYVVKVTVAGDHGSGDALVNVTVRAAARVNQPPRAVVIPPTQDVLLPASLVCIDGRRSTDDGGMVTYRWEEVKGPPHRSKAFADTPLLRLSDLEAGNYTFSLTVTDSDGLSDSTMATVRVSAPPDLAPVADAGPNLTVTLPLDRVTLCGNRSSDDHGIVSYLWTLSSGSWPEKPTMQGAQTALLQLSDLREGQYPFLLTVTDSAGQQASDSVTLSVQAERNAPPVAVVGPDQSLIFPISSIRLDGSSSTDDRGITAFHWEALSGPSGLTIEDSGKAVTMVTGFQAGHYTFRLTVEDQQGATDSAYLNVTVCEGVKQPLSAHTSGGHTLVLPNNSVVLQGNVSGADPGSVSYLWVRDAQSPAAGDVLYGSERWDSLHLANLVEGTYLFQLRVSDPQGRLSAATATVEVLPDPLRQAEVELELQVAVSQVSQQQMDTLVGQLAELLHMPDANVTVRSLSAGSEVSTVLRLSAQAQGEPLPGPLLARRLRERLLGDSTHLLPFRVLRVDTSMCLLRCSDHGRCDPITKRCVCEPFWMENPIRRLLQDRESNCDWSVLYVVGSSFVAFVCILSASWACICCCKRRKRTKVRKKTKYTILDNMDEQERMELRPKYNIKHRSTEHNSSLMMSESEFDSDQDTIFSRERQDRGKNQHNGACRNGGAFNARTVDS